MAMKLMRELPSFYPTKQTETQCWTHMSLALSSVRSLFSLRCRFRRSKEAGSGSHSRLMSFHSKPLEVFPFPSYIWVQH